MLRALAAALLLSGLAAGCAERVPTGCDPLVLREHEPRGGDGLWSFDVILTACERTLTVRTEGCRPGSELHPTLEVDGRVHHVGFADAALPADARSCDPLYDPVSQYELELGATQQVTRLPWDGTVAEHEADPNARRLSGPQTLRVEVAGHSTSLTVDVGK